MNVEQLMEQVEKRQSGQSNERYARNFGISGTTLFRWYKGDRKPDLVSIRNMAKFYQMQGDTEMVKYLADYALFGDASS